MYWWVIDNTTGIHQLVEMACLLMSIDEHPENMVIPKNSIIDSTLGSLQSQIQDLSQEEVALTT